MFKLAVAGTFAAVALAQEHPINEDIIAEIKEKTDLWQPAEVSENPMRFYTIESLRGRFGTVLNS